jgi:hypothetical protein
MRRRASGAVFGELLAALVPEEDAIEAEVKKTYGVVAPMSIKASDKVKKVLVSVLKWWTVEAAARVRTAGLSVPVALVDYFVREVCTSKMVMPVLGNAIFPYFTKSSVDTELVARIIRTKVSDAMIGLFVARPRTTPKNPVRLSYAEATTGGIEGGGRSGGIDWGDVSFEDGAESGTPSHASKLVFAGSRMFAHWSANLGPFYVKNRGGEERLAPADPRVTTLSRILGEVERAHAG